MSPSASALPILIAPDASVPLAASPWRLSLSDWKDIALRTWRAATMDNIGLVSAGVAFYAFVAIVPLLAATVLTYGLIASPRSVLANIGSLAHVLPRDIASLIAQELLNVVHTSSGKKGAGVLVALLIALYGASNASGSIVTALNIAYEEKEKRGFIEVTVLSLVLTVAAVVMALLAVASIAVLQFISDLLPRAPIVVLVSKIATPIVLAGGAGMAAAALYHFGPSRDDAQWKWLTPGSVFSAVGWLAVTAAFGLYLTRFAHYDVTYGSLGAVVALLTWIYLSAYVFLFGGELNNEVGRQAGRAVVQVPETLAPLVIRPSNEVALSPLLLPAPAPPHAYLTSRATTHAGSLVGVAKIGMITSAIATIGLGLLRKRGRAVAGAVLLTTAAGLALLGRED